MELRHLRYFCAVAKALNFSRAAEKLRVAQPALSRQIKDLEEEAGVQLFERTTARVALTEAGRYFYLQTEKLLSQLDLSITGAQQIARGSAGQLNIGVDWNMPNLALAAAAHKFRERHPMVSLELREIAASQHIPSLRSGQIDLGFVPPLALGPRKDLETALLYTCSISVVVPSHHRFAKRDFLLLRELKDDRWLLLDKTSHPGFRSTLLKLLRPSLFAPHFGKAATSFEGIIGLVGAGDGVALMPTVFMRQAPSSVRVILTDCVPFELNAVWLKIKGSPLRDSFLTYLRAELEKAMAPEGKRPRSKTKKTAAD